MPDPVLTKDILDYYRPPLQPFDDDEIDLIVSVSGVPRSKVWVIAWMTTMKLREAEQFDGSSASHGPTSASEAK